MARNVITTLIDDLDGTEASETVTFSIDGTHLEIDLSEENATRLRADIGEWSQHARRVRGDSVGPRRSARVSSGTRRADLEAVRAWARGNGYAVSDRGRVAQQVLEAYDRAH